MKLGKKLAIGLICVLLSCILVLGITIGLLSSGNSHTDTDTADTGTTDTTPETLEDPTVDEPELEPELESDPEPELQWNYKFKFVGAIFERCFVGDIAYKSQSSTFNIDEVTLTVSFGVQMSMGYGVRTGYDIPEFDFYFTDPSGDMSESIYTIRTIKEQFFSEKYDIDTVYEYDINAAYDDTDDLYYHYEYAHTEEITIPKELFTESEGVLRMVIGGINVSEKSNARPNFMVLGMADIKYQVQGDKIVLSSPYNAPWYC